MDISKTRSLQEIAEIVANGWKYGSDYHHLYACYDPSEDDAPINELLIEPDRDYVNNNGEIYLWGPEIDEASNSFTIATGKLNEGAENLPYDDLYDYHYTEIENTYYVERGQIVKDTVLWLFMGWVFVHDYT